MIICGKDTNEKRNTVVRIPEGYVTTDRGCICDAPICDGTDAYWNRKDRSDFGSSEERRTKSEESVCVDCGASA